MTIQHTKKENVDHWRGIIPVGIFAIIGTVMLVVLTYRPLVGAREVGMIFPLAMSETEILNHVGSNGGRVLRFGGFGHLAVVARDDGLVPEAKDFDALFALAPIILSVCAFADSDVNSF
ncbi:hypothetical protein [Thalassospira alkalitolerans]|uniref:hypothetical protein n=1 Tax=Thalassospira alkalitolerans TaxID=1293890 RepID=UPI003AA8FFE5